MTDPTTQNSYLFKTIGIIGVGLLGGSIAAAARQRKLTGKILGAGRNPARMRAAQKAGLKRIPAYVREAGDENMLELALVENIQREDLDAIEVAVSYQRLIEEFNLTQEGLGDRVGKKRATVANYLRLLNLPAEVQTAIRESSCRPVAPTSSR